MLFARACVIINYMRKKAAIIITVLAVLACSLLLAACSGTELESVYSGVVEEFYGDGMTYTSQYSAPSNAVEFKDMPRADKKIVADNRIAGSHITGLYVPAGESVMITIPSSTVTYESSVSVIGSDGSVVHTEPLMRSRNVITCNKGGILLYNIGESSVSDNLNPIEISISGAMPAPFYRYGLDSSDDLGDLTVYGDMLIPLDCGNVRFYVPASQLKDATSLKSVMSWWRSAVGYTASALSASRTDGNIQPVKAYFTSLSNGETDVNLTAEDMEGAFSYSSLTNTPAGLSVLKKVGASLAGERQDGELLGTLAAYNAYMMFKDSFVIYDESGAGAQADLYFSNGYAVLNKMISGMSDNPLLDVMLCLMHSGGTELSNDFIAQFTSGVTAGEIANNAAEVFGVNASAFISDMTGESVTLGEEYAETKEYIPAFNYYTRTVRDQNEQNGYKVYAGDTHRVDFASKTIIYGGTVTDVSVLGSNGWEKREDGYYYTALSENVCDGYTLTVTAEVGGKSAEFVSYGDISLNVNAAAYSLYTSLPLDTVNGAITQDAFDNAVDIYTDYTPEYTRSLGTADCGAGAYEGEEMANDKYTFSVTSFNFEVQEDGVYNFSMINSDTGFCYYRVDFGVGDYEFTMFANYVPVPALGLLSHTEELKAGYVYRFEIFLLQPGISNGVELYVSKDGGEYEQVAAEYMSFPGTSKSQQMEYTSPQVSLQGLAYPDTLYMKADTSAWSGSLGGDAEAVSGERGAVLDGDLGMSSVYALSTQSQGGYTLEFDKTQLDYIRVYAGTRGVTYSVEVLGGEWTTLKSGLTGNAELSADGEFSAIRLTFTGSGTLEIREIEAGNTIDNCTFVPHTSGDIWYEGNWSRMTGGVSVNGSVAQNKGDNAYAEYNFYGDEVAVMSTTAPVYGNAVIYIDGKKYAEISLTSEAYVYQAVVFYAKLDEVGNHTIRLEAKGDDTINIDALAYSEGEYDPSNVSAPFNPYYLFIILAIVAVGVAVCAVLDYRNKHKKKGGSKKDKKQPPADEPSAQEGDAAESSGQGAE